MQPTPKTSTKEHSASELSSPPSNSTETPVSEHTTVNPEPSIGRTPVSVTGEVKATLKDGEITGEGSVTITKPEKPNSPCFIM